MQRDSKKKRLSNPSGIGRREILKSAMAMTGGFGVASLLEPDAWAGMPGAFTSSASAPRSDGGFPTEDLIAKIKSGRRIDVHQHAILPEYQRALAREGIVENSDLKVKLFTKESILEVMSELGMDATVLLPFSSSGIHHGNDEAARYLTRVTNEAAAQLVSEAPQKLGFYAILPLPDVASALKEMETALDTLHASGISVLSTQSGVYVGDTAFDALYSEMNRRSAIVFVHPRRPAYSPESETWNVAHRVRVRDHARGRQPDL